MSTSVANEFARDIHDTFGTNSICPKMCSNRIYAYGFVDIAHTRVRTSRVITDDWEVSQEVHYECVMCAHVTCTQPSTPLLYEHSSPKRPQT